MLTMMKKQQKDAKCQLITEMETKPPQVQMTTKLKKRPHQLEKLNINNTITADINLNTQFFCIYMWSSSGLHVGPLFSLSTCSQIMET